MKNVAFIPVRSGSTRLKLKALEKIGDESLLSIALKNYFISIINLKDELTSYLKLEKKKPSYPHQEQISKQ